MEPVKKISPGVAALIVIVLIGIVATAVIVINNSKSSDADTTNSTDTSQTSPSTNTSETSTASYKDGTYSATGSYSTPGGRESIALTVTIASGAITSTSLEQKGITGEAKQYQSNFASGYKSLVVGKKVDDVSLSRVAGSSLTSGGFRAALEQIKADAAT